MNPRIKAIVEVLKDFARWALSFFIGWLIDNGYAYFANTNLDAQTIFYIGLFFKYADYAWHRYRKEERSQMPTVSIVETSKSQGIYPF